MSGYIVHRCASKVLVIQQRRRGRPQSTQQTQIGEMSSMHGTGPEGKDLAGFSTLYH